MTSKPFEVDGIQTRDEYDQVCEAVFNEIRRIVPRKHGYGWVVSMGVWFHFNYERGQRMKELLAAFTGRERRMIARMVDRLFDLRARYQNVAVDVWATEVLRAAFLVRATYLPGSLKELDYEVMGRRRVAPGPWCPYCEVTGMPGQHDRRCPLYCHRKARPGQASPFAPQMKLTDFPG